ncbi:MAG: hypothetical protein JWP25_1786 [Bradyrhizobium sp.]|nr:hypothetical protein [Bradyrhizobium sp.]
MKQHAFKVAVTLRRNVLSSEAIEEALPLLSHLRGTAFSASSRNFDLNGEVRTDRAKQNSPIIPQA